MSKILNIGCGNRIIEGATNHDRTKHRPEVDVVHDLNVTPWPFADGEYDQVVALAVLEHLDIDLFASFAEIWRVLKVGGVMVVKLPLVTGHNAYDDPSHRWFFTVRSLDQFCPETQRGKDYAFYTPYKWKFIKPPKANDAETSLWATMEKIAS